MKTSPGARHPLRIAVVCDNTMGIPGAVIDDGLALLYLRGCTDPVVELDSIVCTHGNAAAATTYEATRALAGRFFPDVPVLRGADAGGYTGASAASTDTPSVGARHLVELVWPEGREEPGGAGLEAGAAGNPGTAGTVPSAPDLLSLGAVTDLAQAEAARPGTLARFPRICLMGGITHSLVVGGKILDELNYSVDGAACWKVFSQARYGAKLLVADAHHCLPLTFDASTFLKRLASPAMPGADFLRELCQPWFEHARNNWGVHGFVGWDILAAVALVRPDLLTLQPYTVTLNPRLMAAGYLEAAGPGVPGDLRADIKLVVVKDAEALAEHIYAAWEAALRSVFL